VSVLTATWRKPWRAAPAVRHADLDSAHVARDMAAAQYRKTAQAAFRGVVGCLAARETFGAALDARRGNIAEQRRRLQLAQISYRSGTSDYLSVPTAGIGLYNAEIALIALQQQRLAAMASWGRMDGTKRRFAAAR
jgi:multidrug efflux system outer membrane protein